MRFEEVQRKKRTVNHVSGGVVTLGAAPPPVALYEGPTGRRALNSQMPAAGVLLPAGAESEEPIGPGREGTSLGNVSRGETRCPFVNEIAGVGLARRLFPERYPFAGDAVLQLVQPGLYSKGR